MKRLLSIVSVLVVLAGCQTTQPVAKSTALENTAFMRLWTTYSECRSSTDLDAMRAAARQLNQAAITTTSDRDFVLPLPKQIERLVSKPPTRLAVDPKAMAASCTLHTGHAALNAGRNDVAAEMFRLVMDGHPQTEYAYYVEQARLGFAR
jgi:ABC-type Fe3+-hydroxamate transport system substrate-binding protein